ncbi:MAG: DUF5668 domain-containing protein [Anaerolineales bacterium]|jgi:energy-coupling factor transporter transmembrane protein EcfT
MYRRGNIFWGIVLILIAVLLLFKQMGILIGDVFSFFWPLLIIAFGAWLIFGFFARRQPVQGEQVSIPSQGAASASLRFDHGAGRFNMNSGAGPGEILNGTFGGGLDQKTRIADSRMDLRMRSPAQFWAWGPGESLDWDVHLNRELPLSLKVDSGASASVFNLSDLQVTDLDVHTGASSTEITLPAHTGMTNVNIDTGAASLKLHIPTGVSARIRVKSGLASVNINQNRFPRLEGGICQSSDYATATNRADISINTGVGAIEVD